MDGEMDGLVGEAPAGGITLNDEGLPVNMDGEEAKEETIPEEIFQDMKNIFDVFDMQDTKAVPIKELRTIMRALDFDVDNAELELIRKKIDPEGEGFIRFANLKIVMEEKLKDVDTVEDLIE